jgi:hypothetical protein
MIALVALAVGGCEQQQQTPMIELTPAHAVGGVTVDLSVSSPQPTVGEALEVLVVATNTTDQVIRIVSPDSGMVILCLWRKTEPGWTEYLHFPETVLMALHPWALEPGQAREFKMSLPVDHRWPPNETLRLTAELNGHIAESRPVDLRVAPAPR